ncbi:MAG: porin [Planctomycetaceae bacterium]
MMKWISRLALMTLISILGINQVEAQTVRHNRNFQTVSAEVPETDVQMLSRRLQAAEARLRQLETSTTVPTSVSSDVLNTATSRFTSECKDCEPLNFYVDYDGGFSIKPYDKRKTPFGLKINGRMQFRWQGFKRDRKTFTNLSGTTNVESRNDFEIERGRLEFGGFMYDENLQFYINLDADTDDNHRVIFHDFWVNYVFNKALNVHVGKAFVPGSRSWLDGSTRTHLADRSMATTFFRPDRSLGIWATGEIDEGVFYRAMLSNGFETTDLERGGFQIDDQFFYSGSMWWEPLGDFGKGYADLQDHQCAVIRFGHSFAFGSMEPTNATGATRAEQRPFRISDGSRIITPGLFAPGVTVNEFDLYLYAIDFALKYRGFSVNAEYYFRWLQDFSTTGGAIPFSKIDSNGFYVDVGYMLMKKKLELVGRISQVDGFFGDFWEYAAGINWYINGTHKNKLTLDMAVLNGVPTSNSGPGYEVGMNGIFYRAQWQIAF